MDSPAEDKLVRLAVAFLLFLTDVTFLLSPLGPFLIRSENSEKHPVHRSVANSSNLDRQAMKRVAIRLSPLHAVAEKGAKRLTCSGTG